MPISIQLTDNGLGFIMKGEGIVTGQEIIDGVYERFSTEEKTRKYIYGMSDYTDVEDIIMTSEEIRKVAEKDKIVSEINPHLIVAIAAPKDIMFGLSRMFEAYANKTGWTINVFRTMEDAKGSIIQNLKKQGHDISKINFIPT